jgi:hypothetical protein
MLRSMKKELSISLLAMTAAVLPAAAQIIGGLTTSPLYAESGQSYHACNIVNVSTGSIDYKAQILSSSGVVLVDSGLSSLNAGASVEVVSRNYTGFAYCSIYVGNGNGTVRANLTVFHFAGSFFDSLAVSQAR